MKYNISATGNITLESYNNEHNGADGGDSGTLIVWYMIVATVLVMLAVLLLSFCMYHKRVHRKKQHHIDYIRANLPLVRPRISPPNLNGGDGIRSHVINFYRQESRRRSYISYTGVPTDDIYEQEVTFISGYNERNRKRPQNLIDMEYMDLRETSTKHNNGPINQEYQSAESWLGSMASNQMRFNEAKTNTDRNTFGDVVQKIDLAHNKEVSKAYIPTFQAFRNSASIVSDSHNRELGKSIPTLQRSHSVQITRHFPHQECKLTHQNDNFKLLSLPKPGYYTDGSMKYRQNETML